MLTTKLRLLVILQQEVYQDPSEEVLKLKSCAVNHTQNLQKLPYSLSATKHSWWREVLQDEL